MKTNTEKCHDCGKEIKIINDELKNGKILVYNDNENKITIIKCDDCYAKNPGLTSFKQCEVYSRIVGYIRPVQQWNKGKQQEFKERKEFASC
jgi:anaerobic ribonucleoside-triphosphate reductase